MKLPLYVLDIDENLEDETSVFAVGLVLQPAIERNWRTFASEKISFDYDGTLSTSEGKAKAKEYIDKGADVYIVSARSTKDGMLDVADELGISHSNIYAMGSNEAKIAKIIELSISKHYDNNQDVVDAIGKVGEKFVNPKEGETKDEYLSRCIPAMVSEGKEQDQAVAMCVSIYDNFSAKFSVIDEEKRILGGFLMTANQPIYRRDEDGSEYYVTFTSESISKIVNKLAKSGKQLTFNLNHDDNQPVKGAYLLSHFIIDSKLGVSTPQGFTPAPDGSWFGYVKIEDESVWEKAKKGEIRGFSVEGYFNDRKLIDAEQNEYETIKNKIINNMEFNKLKKVLGEDLTNQLKKVFSEETPVAPAIELAETKLLDGSASVKGTIAVGESVTLIMADGSEVPAPDGEHTLEGGVVITVANGVIEEVATAEEENPLNDEAMMSKVNEALEAQANEFNNQIAEIHSKYAKEIEALNAKTTALFSAVGILAKTEEVEEVSKDAKRKSASVSHSQFSRLTEILNKQK
jgi:hydroxymethylpyrimidine pyrophosphatase-like HAD family hydrolase